ncbi:MAG: DNA translocase FtsK [Candidatus Berkelbacteria bacterium]
MAKRRYHRRGQQVSVWESLDWKINPDTTREAAGVILIILGLIILLGEFSLAGVVGHFFINLSKNIWGLVGYIIPFIYLFYGLAFLLPERIKLSPFSVIGMIFTLIFFPALISPAGGFFGAFIHDLFVKMVGPYATILLLFGLTVVSLLVTLNLSLKSLWEKMGSRTYDDEPLVKVNEPRASVFQTLRGQAPVMPPMPQTAVTSRETDKEWSYPPVDLLDISTGKATSGNIPKNVTIIQKTLKDFGVDVSMGDVNVGPTVTQYTLKPADGMKLTNITSRANDLSLALAAKSIRIEAPIPGKSAVGVELPNEKAAVVTLREVLEDDGFKATKSNLTLAVGRDVAGDAFAADLKKMPHLLIAGSTGSGKSVAINSIIVSLLYQNSPSDLRLILVDPKRVEFTHYNGIPHLLCPVVHDVDKTVSTLRWAVSEMDRRFRLLQETARRNIEAYNANPPQGKLPYIVLVIDELADLMAQAGNEVEGAIVRLAQMARAVGIHLVVATQRPSVDVITGLIKANITNRMAFAVASQIDSRTILDVTGAEKLLGNGDMLYLGNDLGKPKRVQGVLVTDKEIDKLTEFLKEQSEPQYDDSILTFHAGSPGMGSHGTGGGEIGTEDELYNDAKETVVMAGKASASLLQRRLRVGYARAARLLDMLEEQGIIGPSEGAKPRDVMIDAISLEHERAQVRMPINQSFPSTPVHEQNNAGFYKPFSGTSSPLPPVNHEQNEIEDGIEYIEK